MAESIDDRQRKEKNAVGRNAIGGSHPRNARWQQKRLLRLTLDFRASGNDRSHCSTSIGLSGCKNARHDKTTK
jgi:hypothetical protein